MREIEKPSSWICVVKRAEVLSVLNLQVISQEKNAQNSLYLRDIELKLSPSSGQGTSPQYQKCYLDLVL